MFVCVNHFKHFQFESERVLRFAIDTFLVIRSYNLENMERQVNIRVGINTGGVVAGVIGRKVCVCQCSYISLF